MDSNPICHPSQAKKWNAHFCISSTSDDWPGWSMDSNPICHPSPNKKWYAHFCITFKFWSLAGLVNGLEPHLPPLSSQKVKCSFLDYVQLLMIGWLVNGLKTHLPPLSRHKMKCSFLHYVQLLMIGRAGRWTLTQSTTLLQPKKWNACFWITFNFWWSAGLVDGLKLHLPPLSSQQNEMLIFGLCWTSDSRLGWSMDSNPIHDLSPAKEWNAHFWITFNFWWSAGLVDGLEPLPPPVSSQKNEMLVFGLCSTSDDWPGWSMESNPICYPSPAKKWNAHFWITYNFGWSARLVNGLKPQLLPLSSQKMKCSFLDYFQLLIIGQAGQWTQTPSATPLKPKKWYAHFLITFNFLWLARLVNGLESHPPPVSSQRMKCSFLDYIQLLMIGRAGRWTWTPSATSFQPKNEMLVFVLRYSSDHQLGWSMDSKPIHHPSSQKMKC